MKIKVCGLTQIDQIEQLKKLGIDYFGFIFYPNSPRYVLNHLPFDEIRNIESLYKVGVFVNENIEEVIEVARKANLQAVQLHGDETKEYIREISEQLTEHVQIIKVIRIGNQSILELQKSVKDLPEEVDFILFDKDSEHFGGTGESFSWNLIDQLDIPKPYFLSGGISLENIDLVSNLKNQPYAVDVNSRFEINPGVKDINLIENLLSRVKN